MATFCLMHGAWHDSSCWEPMLAPLRDLGHVALAPDLPLGDPTADSEARARPALDAVAGAPDRVVVVGHSTSSGYAALVASACPGSLLVHLCPRLGQFATPANAPPAFREGIPFPSEGPDGRSVWDPDVAIATLYPRVPPRIARSLAERRIAFCLPPGEFPLERHPSGPVALIYAAHDEIFNPEWSRFMARAVLGVEPIELAGGHFPMLEDPVGTARLLDWRLGSAQ